MNIFDYQAKQQGLPVHDLRPVQPDAQTVTAVRRAIDANRSGCKCREYVGDALKVEAYCPVHGDGSR